jgi:hypothetical protein
MFLNLVSLSNKLVAYSLVDDGGAGATADSGGISTDPTITSIIGTVISAALGMLGVIFLGLVIYGGILWMTSEGEEAKVEKARKIITDSIIGLIVVMAAYAISFFIFSALAPK